MKSRDEESFLAWSRKEKGCNKAESNPDVRRGGGAFLGRQGREGAQRRRKGER